MKHTLAGWTLTAAVTISLPALASAQQPETKDKMKKDGMMHEETAMALAKGMFAGADNHVASGSYQIVMVDGKPVFQTSADLSVDPGAPDVYVVLSPGPKVGKKDGIWLGKLASHTGAQSFAIPADAKLDGLTTVVLWCKKYSVPIGTAAFDPSGLKHGMMDKMK